MIRQIIKIDEEKCNGCGLCAEACHEGAIGMVEGKARLLRDDYCDGLGNCLPVCPTGAITFEQREAAAFDEEAVKKNMKATTAGEKTAQTQPETLACGCPGTHSRTLRGGATKQENTAGASQRTSAHHATVHSAPVIHEAQQTASALNQWPVQLKLVPPNAPYFDGAHLLIAADCTAYAYGNFHNDFMKNKITLIGCPKLDEGDYSEKLTAILKSNDIKSVTVVRMEVPCCAGIANAAVQALRDCGKMIPWSVKTISTDGNILEQ